MFFPNSSYFFWWIESICRTLETSHVCEVENKCLMTQTCNSDIDFIKFSGTDGRMTELGQLPLKGEIYKEGTLKATRTKDL